LNLVQVKALAGLYLNFMAGLISEKLKNEESTWLTTVPLSGEAAVLFVDGALSSTNAKISVQDIIENKVKSKTMKEYAESEGLLQQNNEESLRTMVQKIITEQEGLVAQFKGGKESILQALVGVMMKESKGSANPQVALKLFKEELSK
jgi:aspartyl-tRNA(Asn)/glutamyl-tRNA(Gln) amidotransferase subunit B